MRCIDSELSRWTCFGQWYVSKCYTRIDLKSTLYFESCPVFLMGTLLSHREAWISHLGRALTTKHVSEAILTIQLELSSQMTAAA